MARCNYDRALLKGFNQSLLYWRGWFVLGIGFVLLVVYLSLADVHLPEVPSTIGDKINHLLAYGALMGWFGQLYLTTRSRVVVALVLILLGVTMEIAQGMTAHRFFDWLDAFANSLGVVGGFVVLSLGADKILLWVERRFLSKGR